MNLAMYPLHLISATPIPRGFLLKLKKFRKAKSFLYPHEEEALLRCTDIPLVCRVLWGVMVREGPRVGEFLGNKRKGHPPCTWRMFDLRVGMLLNDWNKTNDPRMWAMREDVTEALRRWRAKYHPNAGRDSLVFVNDDGTPLNPDRLAERFRTHLKMAGVDRAELFERHEKRLRLRAHDLRATFVTLSLAAGKTERWVMARTGHKSSDMVTTYARSVAAAQEVSLPPLSSMVESIPEIAVLPPSEQTSRPCEVEAKPLERGPATASTSAA